MDSMVKKKTQKEIAELYENCYQKAVCLIIKKAKAKIIDEREQ